MTSSRSGAAVNGRGGQRGEYSANTTQLFGEIACNAAFGRVALEPFANLAYVRVDGGVREPGVAAMNGSARLDTTFTTLGARAALVLSDTLSARASLGWRHAFGDVTPVAALAFQSGGQTVNLSGAPIARDAMIAEAGLDLKLAKNVSLGISWSGQIAKENRSNAINGNFAWRF